MSNESKLYDPLDLGTQPVRKRKAGTGFNDLRRNGGVEQGRVVKQPISPEWMRKPLRPASELFRARKGTR
jgi:hypothetical protein